MTIDKTSDQLKNNGFYIIKNFVDQSIVKKIKSKTIKILNDTSHLMKAVNISKVLETQKKNKLCEVMIHKKKFFITKKEFSAGYKIYSKKTDSVEVKDPLILIPEFNELIFSEKIISVCKKFFKSSDMHLLYVAFRCHFKNNLPDAGLNFYHLDETYNKTIKSKALLKFSIPFHLKLNEKTDKFEFNLITVNKKKIQIKHGKDILKKMHYSSLNKFIPAIRKKNFTPKVTSGDCIFFDPINFFHNAVKPKKLRIMLYVVVGRKSNYISKKTKKIKMLKNDYNNLSKDQKNFAKLIKKI